MPSIDAPLWSSLLVSILWGFTRTMWRKRNELVHQSTRTAETDGRILSLHHQATNYYLSYSTNPDFLLPRFHDLFTHRTLSQCLQMSPDFLQCWISSVQTAIRATKIHICFTILPSLCWSHRLFLHPIRSITLLHHHPDYGVYRPFDWRRALHVHKSLDQPIHNFPISSVLHIQLPHRYRCIIHILLNIHC